MNSALSDSSRPLQTYQHLYGYGGSNSGRGNSSGRSSPARSSQVDDIVPAPVHGFSPERHRDRSNGNLEDVRKRIARMNANASSALIPFRSDGVRRKSKRRTYSEPLLSSRLVAKPYTTTQRPGRVIANASMRAAVGGEKGNTYVADVNPTFCIDGSIRYIEPINDRVAWTAEYDGSIRIRALPQGSEVRIIEGRENTFCTCLLYLQEYRCVWVAFNDGFMRVYDVEGFTLQKEFVQHAGGVNCMVELEGSVYTGGVDWKIGLWNPETITFERLFYGHAGGVRCLYPFSGASGSILFSGSDDGSIKAWDPYAPVQTEEDRACLHTFKGHDRGVLCLEAIGPLSQLWSGGEDGTLRVWDLKTLECLNVLEAHTSPVSCLLLVESRLWSGDKYGHIILWDVLLQSPLQEITSRMQGAKLGMVLAMKKVQPATCWKIWTAGCTGFVQCWNADTIPIVFDRKYAYKYGQQGIHDLLLELETFAQLLEEELASTKEEASRQRERGRMEVQHILESKQLVEEENEDLRHRLRELKMGKDGDEHAYEKVDYLERSPGLIPDREEKEKYENQRRQNRELQHQIQELQQENDRLKHQLDTAAAAARSASAASSTKFSFTSSPSDAAATPAVVVAPPVSSPLAAALFPPASAYKGEIALTPYHVLLPGRYWEQILQDRPHQLRELAKEDICMAIGIPDAQLRDLTLGTVDVVRISQEEAEKEEGEDYDEGMTGTPDTRRLRYRKESRLPTLGEARDSNTPYDSPSLPTSPSGSRSDSFRFNEGSTTTKTVVLPRGTHSAAQEDMVLKVGAGLCLRVGVIRDVLFPKEEVQRRLDSFSFPRLTRLHQRMQNGIEGMHASEEEGQKSRLPEKVGLDAAEERIRELERRLAERSQALPSPKVEQESSESVESEISFTEIETEEKEEVPPKVSRSNKSVRFDESEVGTDTHAPWEGEEVEEGEDEEDEDEEGDDEEDAEKPKGKEKGSAARMEFLRVELEHEKDNVEYYKDVISEKEKQRLALAQEVDRLRSLLAAAPSASPFSIASMGKNSAADETDAASIERRKNADKVQTIQVLSDLQQVLTASKKKAEMVREDMQAFFRQLTAAPRPPQATTTTVPRSGRRWSNPAAGGGLSSSLDLLHRPEDPNGWRGREEREAKQIRKEAALSSSVPHGHRPMGASPPYHERGAVEKPSTAYDALSSGVPPSLSAGPSKPPSISSFQKPLVQALAVPPIPHRSPSLNTSLSWASQSQQQIAAHMQEHPYKERHLPPPLQSFPPANKNSWGAGGSRPTSSSFYPVGPPTRVPQGSRNSGSAGARPLTPERIQRDTLERPTYPAWARAAVKSTAEEPPRKRNASSSSTSLSDEDDLETDVRKLYEQQFTKENRPASASASHIPHKNYGMSSSNAKVPQRGAAATSRPTSLSHYAVPAAANPPQSSQQRQEREQKYPSKTSRDARSFSPSVSMASPPPGQHFKVLNHTTNPYIGLSAADIQALPLPSEISAGYQAHRHSRHSAEDIASMNAALLARVADVESVMAILSEQHEQSQSRASLGIS